MFKRIFKELSHHIPFTLVGALTGIIIVVVMVLLKTPQNVSGFLFDVFHPAHVVLSAMVTTAIYRKHVKNIVIAVIVGYVGSIGIATLSDIVFPYLGGELLGAHMHFHVGFVEEWWLVNPLAVLGIIFGLFRPNTKLPHSAHVLVSTWASLFYLVTFGTANWLGMLPQIFVILFVAVWVPCCLSDIVFPLLFAGKCEGECVFHEH